MSYCVSHAIEQQGYTTTLMQPNRRDFIVTATLMVDAITRRQTAVVEVRFFAHDQATTVELRNGISGGRVTGFAGVAVFVKHVCEDRGNLVLTS